MNPLETLTRRYVAVSGNGIVCSTQDREYVRQVHRGDSKHSVSETLEAAPVLAKYSAVGVDGEPLHPDIECPKSDSNRECGGVRDYCLGLHHIRVIR